MPKCWCGVVRAFDARTGAERWRWSPLAGQEGRTGAGNAWSVFNVDAARDLVFAPTGSPSPDFFGGLRPGAIAHANSVVALRASTGALVWSFQTVHYDLWGLRPRSATGARGRAARWPC